MYFVIVYDIGVERVNNICKYLKQHLNWVQNSVFEGELTEGEFEEVKARLNKLIDKSSDSLLIYSTLSENYLQKMALGTEKAPISRII